MDNTELIGVNEKKGGITSFALKIIAISLMVCDHASVVFIPNEYTWLRVLGRIAFPIFAFMIAEGASKTRSIPKYMARLAIFGVVSEVPFDLALLSGGEKVFDNSGSNVYFTLLFGLLAIYCIRNLKGKLQILAPFGVLLSLAAAWLMSTDYGVTGVASIVIFYFATTSKKTFKIILSVLAISVACFHITGFPGIYASGIESVSDVIHFNILEVPAFLSLPIILNYHGDRGKKMNKYFFYAFYPAHIMLLYLINLLVS